MNNSLIPLRGNHDQFVSCKLIEKLAKFYTDWIFQGAEIVWEYKKNIICMPESKELFFKFLNFFFSEWSGKKEKKKEMNCHNSQKKCWIQTG